jgi:uncharacterized Zn finger protein
MDSPEQAEHIALICVEQRLSLPTPLVNEALKRGWGNRLIPAVEKGLQLEFYTCLEQAKVPGNELLPEAVAVTLLRGDTGTWYVTTFQAALERQGLWEHARPAFEAHLEAIERFDVLVNMGLRAKDVELTLRWVDRLTDGSPHYQASSLRMAVARAAAKDHAHEALVLYAEEAEVLIAGRNRKKYQEAAEILMTMRDIYKRIEQPEAFDQYIAALRAEYQRLAALQQELDSAGF